MDLSSDPRNYMSLPEKTREQGLDRETRCGKALDWTRLSLGAAACWGLWHNKPRGKEGQAPQTTRLEREVAWITGGLKVTVGDRFALGAMGRFAGFSDKQAMFNSISGRTL